MTHQACDTRIYKSSDYSIFRLMDGNRQLNQKKITNLIRAINSGLNMLQECPIIVVERNGRLDVIDGQHRFWVSKTLKLPVHYVICERPISLRDIALLNSNSERWKNTDYIHLYVQQGLKDYIIIQDFIEEYNLPLSTSLRLLSNGGLINTSGFKFSQEFKLGSFKVRDYDGAKAVAETTKLFYRYTLRKSRPFLVAMTQLLETDVDLEEIAKVSRNGADLQHFKYAQPLVNYLTGLLEEA